MPKVTAAAWEGFPRPLLHFGGHSDLLIRGVGLLSMLRKARHPYIQKAMAMTAFDDCGLAHEHIPTDQADAVPNTEIRRYSCNFIFRRECLPQGLFERAIRADFQQRRDLEVAQSYNVGQPNMTVWASGRITQGAGKKELAPAFFQVTTKIEYGFTEAAMFSYTPGTGSTPRTALSPQT